MSKSTFLCLALVFSFILSWIVFVLVPLIQLGNVQQTISLNEDTRYPVERSGLAQEGAHIYRANGCNACHTQQLAPVNTGSDIARGWGTRRTLAYDYIFDNPPLIGSQRIGPDLANIGMRADLNTLLVHLYAPRVIVAGSIMPPYRFLFETRPVGNSGNALRLPKPFAAKEGYEVIPRPEGVALASYLMSLRVEGTLYETPRKNVSAAPDAFQNAAVPKNSKPGNPSMPMREPANTSLKSEQGSTQSAIPQIVPSAVPNAFE